MATVVAFHHALGKSSGFNAFVDTLRAAGHDVHAPDLFDGRTFDAVQDGVAYAGTVGFDTLLKRGKDAIQTRSSDVVYCGVSLGVMPAQMLAQTRTGTRGAILIAACAPADAFGDNWPSSVPVQIHAMEHDTFFTEDGDFDAARELARTAPDAQLFLYPGSGHLFIDASHPDYEPQAAQLTTDRILDFLKNVDRSPS